MPLGAFGVSELNPAGGDQGYEGTRVVFKGPRGILLAWPALARAARVTFFHILEALKTDIENTSKQIAKVMPMASQAHSKNHEKVTLERKQRHRDSVNRADV